MSLSAIVITILCVALSALLARATSLAKSERAAVQESLDKGFELFQCKQSLEAITAERDALHRDLCLQGDLLSSIQAERDVLVHSFESAMRRTPAEAMDIVAKRHAFWESVGTKNERAPTAGETATQEAAELNLPDPFMYHIVHPSDVCHPFQMIVREDGVLRFKRNAIVAYLTRNRLNDLAEMDFTREDREQLAQLMGYSLDGFCELSYVSDETRRAVEQAQANFAKEL